MTVETDKLPADVREQDIAVGGALDGALPRLAVPVVATGIGLVRETPAMKASTFGGIQAAAALPFTIGEEPMRRRILISAAPNAVATSYLVVASDRASLPNGYPIGQGQRETFRTSGALFVAAIGADLTWGFLSELDQG